jgi:tetratricopeptide (TPR) repeat protein
VDPRTQTPSAARDRPPATRLRAVARRLTAPPRAAWRWFAHQPRAIQVGLVLILLAALAAGGYYGRSYVKKRERTREVGAAWGEFNTAARKYNLDGVRAALDRVLAADPAEPTAVRYKAMLDRGEADADAPGLAVLLVRDHLQHGRLPEAAREAEKVLAESPKDWLSRCVVAEHALRVRKDRALVEEHLSRLPDPDDPAAALSPDGLHYALRVFAAVGRDAAAVRRTFVRRVLPHLRGGQVAAAPPAARVMLLECYLAAFEDPGSVAELAGHWAVADQLAHGALADALAAGDVPTLVSLGNLGPWMRSALQTLRNRDPAALPDERFKPLAKAVDERTRRAWQTVRGKEPGRVEAYVGLARLALAENNPTGALAQVVAGLEACGDSNQLLEFRLLLAAHSRDHDHLRQLADSLYRAAAEAKTDPAKWCLLANVWRLLRDNGKALAACAQALAVRPDFPPACRIVVRILVESGSPPELVQARELLARLGEPALRTDPELAFLHARVLAETLWVLRDDEFDAVLAAQDRLKPRTSVPSVLFLDGVLSAPAAAERAEWVAARAAQVLARDPEAPGAGLVRFAALYRLADLSVTADPKGGPPVWDVNRVAAALRAYEELRLEDRSRPDVVTRVAALQLKGQGNAAAALRTAGALVAAEGSLRADQLEVLGAVLTANGRAADAVRVLERAEALPNATAGVRVALAVAYHRNNQPDERDRAVARADDTPNRSAREQAELVAAKLLFRRENP